MSPAGLTTSGEIPIITYAGRTCRFQRGTTCLSSRRPRWRRQSRLQAVVARLWISSSAIDTDFTAKLIDVYPPNPDYPYGYAMNLSDGILRVRYRDGFNGPVMMKPGTSIP